ncbi:MAG: hypothetical protein ACREYF_12915 [Gammaproteobacteria bacterium]
MQEATIREVAAWVGKGNGHPRVTAQVKTPRESAKDVATEAQLKQRGHHREPCLFGEEDYDTYLHGLGEALKETRCSLHAYALITYTCSSPPRRPRRYPRLLFRWDGAMWSISIGSTGVGHIVGQPLQVLTWWSINRWVAQAERDAGHGDGRLTTVEREELVRLRREVKQPRIEREILSKAAAWFAQETVPNLKRASDS